MHRAVLLAPVIALSVLAGCEKPEPQTVTVLTPPQPPVTVVAPAQPPTQVIIAPAPAAAPPADTAAGQPPEYRPTPRTPQAGDNQGSDTQAGADK
jgi:hypothetical protein